MSFPNDSRRGISVAGDVTIDWNIARTSDESHAFASPGGAALLGRVMQALVAAMPENPPVDVSAPQVSPNELNPTNGRLHHRYATWERYGGGQDGAWRMSAFLGARRGAEASAWKPPIGSAGLILLDDGALGFRDEASRWPELSGNPWVVLKTTAPVAQGSLYSRLLESPQKLIVLFTADDLRRSEVRISRDLSWERTAQDVAWELLHNPRINSLARAAHVVVSFGAAGAFVHSRESGSTPAADRLIFDTRATERSWEESIPGGVFGSTTCVSAGIALSIITENESPDVPDGVVRGLSALRALHRTGFCEAKSAALPAHLEFPAMTVVNEVMNPQTRFAEVEVRDPLRHSESGWSILEDRHTDGLATLARRIVTEGVGNVLHDVPIGVFGHLVTVDRREIESFRSIRLLVREYLAQKKVKRPLNLAVFGTPGSGKSFGVTQVAESLAPGQMRTLEFNLSQFDDAQAIHGALHQVRDVALTGSVPLVFWDEFDTALDGRRLGWLRHFLAPMQDGRFQEGQIAHPIGRAIFVFAGGTSATMEGFGGGMDQSDFRAVKGPDFVSRLRGYVDVLGPNQLSDRPDPFFILRRALLLRGMLERDAPWIFRHGEGRSVPDIDPGILRAFLETRVYRHGARSLESIIGMSSLANRAGFERSALPAAGQLELHVDATDFMACMQRLDLDGELLERMAEAAHSVFARMMSAAESSHTQSVSFAELPEDERDQNRDNVRDIPQKLAAAGYLMTPARSNEPPFRFPGDALEMLAEREHERWVRGKLAAGWRHGARTDKPNKVHQALLPWRKMQDDEMTSAFGAAARSQMGTSLLPESEKEKDRELVRAIPQILAEAGYTIVRSQHPDAPP